MSDYQVRLLTDCIKSNLEGIRGETFGNIHFLLMLVNADDRVKPFSKISFNTKRNTIESMSSGIYSFEVWVRRKWYQLLSPIKKYVITLSFKDDKVWQQITKV